MVRPISDLDFKRRLIGTTGPLLKYLDSMIPSSMRPALHADDLLQEVWITAFRRVQSNEAVEVHTFDAWLKSIAHQRLMDAMRVQLAEKRGGRRFRRHAARASSLQGLLRRLASSQKSPSKVVRDRETVGQVRKVIEALPERERQAVLMRHIEGRSYQSIAESLHCTVPMVRGVLSRGIRRMRKLMEDPARFLSDVHSAVLDSHPAVA